MTETSNAEKLRITDGFVVWVIGRNVEETTLLDPLPEGVETVEHRDEDEPEVIDAAILFVEDRNQLAEQLDEVLPRIGSIPLVWVSFPVSSSRIDTDVIGELVADYGWHPIEITALDETWSAVRLLQA
ncbi:MAG: hypothetical protein JWQ70_3233 [Aeromicrobium sp.]|jgi:hypothetical protein|nr:hypothetical protein [Aeromicrobium sp.]